MANGRYWLHTLGCPKNQVDSDKLAGLLGAQGLAAASAPEQADLIVVNTCAFIEAARQESIEAVLDLADAKRTGARLVVTGCMAERYGEELAQALPEVDRVAGFGVALEATPISISATRRPGVTGDPSVPDRLVPPSDPTTVTGGSFDLLELPRPATGSPWAYVKVAEGCDRRCGFCAIPSFRGPQRSRTPESVLAEVAALAERGPDGSSGGVSEIVLVAQDLVSYGRDRGRRDDTTGDDRAAGRAGTWPIVRLLHAVTGMVSRTRLLYVYPSGLTDELVEAVLATGVPYFDLSLQHVSRPLLARMRRWGDGERFLRRIREIRDADPLVTLRSSFILGYPGETEEDHDQLLAFLDAADLDWAGFFPFSPEAGTPAADLAGQVPAELALERLRECQEIQDAIPARHRDRLVGQTREVLVDARGRGRSVHEAPEIDGIVHLPDSLAVGSLVDVTITASLGTDLIGEPVNSDGRPVANRATGAPVANRATGAPVANRATVGGAG